MADQPPVDRSRERKAKLDYNYWVTKGGWTCEEFAALSLEIDPNDVDDPLFQDSGMFVDFEELRNRAERAARVGVIKSMDAPSKWLKWADKNKVDVSTSLRAAVGSKDAERDLGRRERTTLLRLIYGMAMAKYGYDARAAKQHAIPDIRSDLIRAGLDVDDETIRNWLKAAVTEFGEDPSGSGA